MTLVDDNGNPIDVAAEKAADERAYAQMRPLRRISAGVWRSRDERWTFLRHWSDPQPQRWFAFFDAGAEDGYEREPANGGSGITTLADCVAWAEEQD